MPPGWVAGAQFGRATRQPVSGPLQRLCGLGPRPKPQRHRGRLHDLADDRDQLGRQGVQLDLLAQPGAEPRDRLGGVVAASVEASIHCRLDPAAGRLEHRRDRQRGDRHDQAGVTAQQLAEAEDHAGVAADEQHGEQTVGEGAVDDPVDVERGESAAAATRAAVQDHSHDKDPDHRPPAAGGQPAGGEQQDQQRQQPEHGQQVQHLPELVHHQPDRWGIEVAGDRPRRLDAAEGRQAHGKADRPAQPADHLAGPTGTISPPTVANTSIGSPGSAWLSSLAAVDPLASGSVNSGRSGLLGQPPG
jgi:hypothetical protein